MKIGIYLRNSLDRDMNKVSVDYQREQLLALCRDRLDCVDPVEYLDRNVCSKKGTSRPRYADLCEDIANGVIGRVAVWHQDRLTRVPAEIEQFLDLADRYGVELANVSGDIDLSTPSGRFMFRQLGIMARYEMEQKSARQKAANEHRANNGKAWNMRTFGYDGNEIVKAEADLIVKGCADLIDGHSLYGIAAAWNKLGVKTVKGGQWNGSTVRQVLSRPRNAGLAVYDVHGKNTPGSNIKQRIEASIREGVETDWPAIISRDTLDAVLGILSDPKRHTGKSRARVHLLSGLAYCGVCGKKISSGSRKTRSGNKRAVYACKQPGCLKIIRSIAPVDAFVVDIVTGWLARPDAAEIFAPKSVDTKALSAEVAKIRALIADAEREYDEGIIDGRRLKGRRAALVPKLDAVERQLVGASTSNRLAGLVGNPKARAVFDGLSLDRQRAVVDAVVKVTVLPTAGRTGGVFDPTLIRVEQRQDD
jgi:site-specific DNA recombinase